jgi:hypothetical protein
MAHATAKTRESRKFCAAKLMAHSTAKTTQSFLFPQVLRWFDVSPIV